MSKINKKYIFISNLRIYLDQIWPGLLLGACISGLAFGLSSLQLSGLSKISPLMLAIVIGMIVRNFLGRPESARTGLSFSLRAPLRLGIILLGLQVTLGEILAIGQTGLITLALALCATFLMTIWVGRLLGVAPGLTQLIAAGTSVCGASAIVAANTIVRDEDESVAYALATVTLFGTIAMLSYPVIGTLLNLSDLDYALWIGASVHEVAQVVAAGFAHGQTSGEFATVAKLARVLMLAPLILFMGMQANRSKQRLKNDNKIPVPWFIFGFLGMVLIASTGLISQNFNFYAKWLTQSLLALALAAVGLETDIRKLIRQGWRPLVLGALASLFIGGGTLAATMLSHSR